MHGMLSLSDADAYLLLEPRDDLDSKIPLGSAQKVVVTPKGSPPLSVDGCQGHGGDAWWNWVPFSLFDTSHGKWSPRQGEHQAGHRA